MDSIRKLTTPGSVATERVQEESRKTERRREVKEIKEAKEVKEVEEKTPRATLRFGSASDPLLPLLPPLPLLPRPPPLPFSPCITHLAKHGRLLRSGSSRHVRGTPVQRLVGKHGKGKRFLGIFRNA